MIVPLKGFQKIGTLSPGVGQKAACIGLTKHKRVHYKLVTTAHVNYRNIVNLDVLTWWPAGKMTTQVCFVVVPSTVPRSERFGRSNEPSRCCAASVVGHQQTNHFSMALSCHGNTDRLRHKTPPDTHVSQLDTNSCRYCQLEDDKVT